MTKEERLRKLKRNVKVYQWFQFMREPLFWGPVMISYLQFIGKMSLEEIYFMEAIVMILVIVLEIVTGALADVIGRKKTVLVGTLLILLDTIGFALISAPWHVWAANIVWAIGFSLCSGADQALFYDSLKEINRQNGGDFSKEAKKQQGLAFSRRSLAFAFASVLAGHLAAFDLRLPALISIPGVAISFVLTFLFTEPNPTEKFSFKKQAEMIKGGIHTVFSKSHLLWIVLFVLFCGGVSKVWFFSYNPYFELVELPYQYFGYIFFSLNIVAWLFSKYAYKVEEFIGERGAILLMIASLGVPILLMGIFVAPVFALLVLVQNINRGMIDPFSFYFLNKHVLAHNRATVNSVKSSLSGVGQFISLLSFGYALEFFPLPEVLKILGLVTLFFGVGFYLWYLKIFTKDKKS